MKLFLVLLLALGAALYFPDSRAWVLDKAKPVVDPMLRTATQSEMDKIVTAMQHHDIDIRPEALLATPVATQRNHCSVRSHVVGKFLQCQVEPVGECGDRVATSVTDPLVGDSSAQIAKRSKW